MLLFPLHGNRQSGNHLSCVPYPITLVCLQRMTCNQPHYRQLVCQPAHNIAGGLHAFGTHDEQLHGRQCETCA